MNPNTDDRLYSLSGRDIVVISIQHWDSKIGSNARNLSSIFARDNRVLYVNFPLTRKTFLTMIDHPETQKHGEIIKSNGESLVYKDDGIWVLYPKNLIESVKWLPSTYLFKFINYFNNKRLAKEIIQAISKLGFKDIILFNDNDIFNGYYLTELINPSIYIYYFKDFLQGYAYWKKHAEVMEPELIKKVDAVVANSTVYKDYCLSLNLNSHYIGQGCNLEVFNPENVKEVPDDIKNIKRPIIGYVGAIDYERLDEKILLRLSCELDWSIVLVGPSDSQFEKSSLRGKKNVFFLGPKHISLLPEYIHEFDVCINPQIVSSVTNGNYPLKIDEYLAMGKPVVATRTKAMYLFKEYTYLADNPEEYPDLIREALRVNSQELEYQRKCFAGNHTWDKCVSEIYSVINSLSKTTVNSK